MRIALTRIIVNDPIAAYEFYTQVLGFKEKLYMPDAQLAIVVSADDPDGTSLLLEPKTAGFAADFQEGAYAKGLPVIVFGVDDAEAEYQRLSGRGVKFTKKPDKTQWGTQAIFDDTCGNLIQLHQEPGT